MAALDGFRAVLANLEVTIAANWQGTIDQIDPKFLHDLRIAVRRTRTVLGAAKSVLPTAVLDPAREGFAWLAGATGAARDLDVYLLEWERYTDPLGVGSRGRVGAGPRASRTTLRRRARRARRVCCDPSEQLN